MIFVSIPYLSLFRAENHLFLQQNFQNKNMRQNIQDYIDNTLNSIAILTDEDVSYEDIKILEYRTHHESGDIFKHQNDDLYAIAVLFAITNESAKKISRELKKNKNLSLSSLKTLVEKHLLKCYVSGNSNAYDTWKTGDIGIASIQFDDTKKTIIPTFKNLSAEEREK